MKKGIEKIMKEINESIERYQAEIEAWQKVEVKTKKNGEEYQNIKRAITGAKVNARSYDDETHPKMYVFFKSGHKYEEDWIDLYFYLDNLPENDPRRKNYTRQLFRQTCMKTTEEIKESINERIKIRTEQIESLKKQIAAAETAYTQITEMAEAIGKTILSLTECSKGRKNSLAYALAEEAADIVKYC